MYNNFYDCRNMLIQYTHYVTIVTDHKTQFFTYFSKKKSKNNYWLFQRVIDASFRYFHVWENFWIKRDKGIWLD